MLFEEMDPDHQELVEIRDLLTHGQFTQALYDSGFAIRFYNHFGNPERGYDLIQTIAGKSSVLNGTCDEDDVMPSTESHFDDLQQAGMVEIVSHRSQEVVTRYYFDSDDQLWHRDQALPGCVVYTTIQFV